MSPSPSRISPCSPPADPGSAAVVAHAAVPSSGAGIKPPISPYRRILAVSGFLIPLVCHLAIAFWFVQQIDYHFDAFLRDSNAICEAMVPSN